MRKLRILQWNCRSLSNKLCYFNCTTFKNCDILVCQETFLSTSSTLNLPGKICYRLDRQNRPGGGLLIAINASFSSCLLQNIMSNSGNEIMGIRIMCDSFSLNVVNVYSASGRVTEDLDRISHSLQGPSLILGDFNLHHPLWGASAPSRYSEVFADWLVNSSFCLLNHGTPTHVAPNGNSSLIDLSLCSAELLARSSIQVDDDLYDSDHFPIAISINFHHPPQSHRMHFCWPRVCQEVNDSLRHHSSIDYYRFSDIVQEAMRKNQLSKAPSPHMCSPAWWNARCSNLLHQKRFLLKRATQLISPEYWSKYKKTAAKLRQAIKAAKRNFWDATCRSAKDPRILYKIFKKFKNRLSDSPDSQYCISHDGGQIIDALAQAELFAGHFSEEITHEPIPITYGDGLDESLNKPFEMPELTDAIHSTKPTSPGEDRIGASFFKGLNHHSLMILLQIYNSIWSSGEIPRDWLSATILPILKPGKNKKDVSSYRPIALTSVMGKICERMITARIRNFLINNSSLHSCHLGFIPFRDSHTAITKIHHEIAQAKREKKYIVGISLDLQAAYDSVYIDGLVYKCAQLGITGPILRWIHRFLSQRSIKIAWRNTTSSAHASTRGVPQGAVLSPILFTIFLADFFEVLDGLGVKYLVYADDIFIYCFCDSLEICCIRIQNALRSIAQWCSYWKLVIRPDKCHAINLSRRFGECDHQFSINGGLIEWVDEMKFLGFYLTRRGGFRKQVDYLRRKAFKRINILKALSQKRYGARSFHLVTLVNSNIRSLIDYGAAILSSACNTALKKLEVLQTTALRVALGLPKWVPNEILRKHADALPLDERIKVLAFGFWIKHLSLNDLSPLWDTNQNTLLSFNRMLPDVENIFYEIGCNPENLIRFQMPLTGTDNVHFYLADLPFQRTDLDSSIIVPFFTEFIHSLPAITHIFATDASKTDALTTIAGCSYDAQFGYKINNVNSIFTAEAIAIGTALDELVIPGQPFIIFTDSLSVLTALQSANIKSSKVILWLYNKIQRVAGLSPSVSICWVPGHRGIPLNEKADHIARNVNEHDVLVDWISPDDLIHFHQCKVSSHNGNLFRQSKYFNSHGCVPSIKQSHLWSNNRRTDVLVTRLLCKMLITPAMLYRFRLIVDGNCPSCSVLDTLDHILFSCVRYQTIRRACWGSALVNGSGASSFLELIKKFESCAVFRESTIKFLYAIDRF